MRFHSPRQYLSFVWALLLALVVSTAAQTSKLPEKTPEQPPAAAEEEKKISPQEAEELFRSVDEILKFVSKDTGLPIKHSVKRRLVSRDEVVSYLAKHMSEDEDAQRLKRSSLVLKKFGLLPPDFDLEKFLVLLLREQVAGYYDPKTKTVNLLDWLDVDQQRPVLAHELTHALQDQSFGLEKWMKATDLNRKKSLTYDDIEKDEISTARQAVVEGQAMVALIDYMLEPTGQSMQSSPQIAEALKQGMLVGAADAIQFRNAPLFLKEALTFPYRYGLDFEAALLTVRGKEKAFAGVFANPPETSRQIMEPQTYLAAEPVASMPLPEFKQIFRNYEPFDVGAIGEFDVAVIIDEYAGVEASRKLYPHWRGGYYYAAQAKNDPTAPLSLLYVSRWSNAERAAEFGAIYARSLSKRYRRAREAVGEGSQPLDMEKLENLTGTHTWITEEGPVVIQVKDDMVMANESTDPQTTEELQRALFGATEAAGK